jgi:hypothetical protein
MHNEFRGVANSNPDQPQKPWLLSNLIFKQQKNIKRKSQTMSIEALTPLIRSILTARDVDLCTISAKRVRKQILQSDPSLSEVWIRENKEQIDKLISSVFEEVAAASAASTSKGKSLTVNPVTTLRCNSCY